MSSIFERHSLGGKLFHKSSPSTLTSDIYLAAPRIHPRLYDMVARIHGTLNSTYSYVAFGLWGQEGIKTKKRPRCDAVSERYFSLFFFFNSRLVVHQKECTNVVYI